MCFHENVHNLNLDNQEICFVINSQHMDARLWYFSHFVLSIFTQTISDSTHKKSPLAGDVLKINY